jgi:CheY-like chemotaxis protein/two-component sensor histidine kinase
MLLWLRMMRRGKLDEGTLERALAVMENSTRLQIRLIEDILDLSRIITGKFHLDVHPVRLSEVIQSAIELARPSAELKGLHLEAVVPAGADPISGDRARLQQVVWNLIVNAIKFTPTGGRVTVRLEYRSGSARITVSDTGKGISADFLPYVFDRFRQADSSSTRQHGGLGLGLAIVRHLVELHGGTVAAESQGEGRGATFTVALPAGDAGARAEAARAEGASAGAHGITSLEGVLILVVEDDPDTREALRTVLVDYHAEVVTAASSAEAIEVMDRSSPDVLLCDIGMPDEDGYALLRKLRAREPERGGHTPAVALTAYVLDEDRRDALLAGFQAHLPKPPDPGELAAVVAALARRGRSCGPALVPGLR